MKNSIGNYAQHAKFWDWGGYDRSPEHEFWRAYAEKFGRRVLSPMCALGETGAYMAERGFEVTAFDFTPEMVEEGRKRFGHLENLTLLQADVRDFHFDMQPADFAFSMDFGHLHEIEDVKRALKCVAGHLRSGGCFALEAMMRMPDEVTEDCPMTAYEPFSQVYPGLKVWKTGHCHDCAETGRLTIMQTFYIEDREGRVENFPHELTLQRYTREEWLQAFAETGFAVRAEYVDHDFSRWEGGSESFRLFELIKQD